MGECSNSAYWLSAFFRGVGVTESFCSGSLWKALLSVVAFAACFVVALVWARVVDSGGTLLTLFVSWAGARCSSFWGLGSLLRILKVLCGSGELEKLNTGMDDALSGGFFVFERPLVVIDAICPCPPYRSYGTNLTVIVTKRQTYVSLIFTIRLDSERGCVGSE